MFFFNYLKKEENVYEEEIEMIKWFIKATAPCNFKYEKLHSDSFERKRYHVPY